MFSLLSKEIEIHNSSNNITNLSISYFLDENKKTFNNQINQINQINQSNQTNQTKEIECRLNTNNFDPMKNSPPNDWQIRLEKRLKNIDNKSKILIHCKI